MLRVSILAVAVLSGACETGTPPGGGDMTDANGSGSATIDAPKLMWVDAAPGTGNGLPCENKVSQPPDGQHNPGQSCFLNCHNHGFTMAGTLYTNATGNSAFVGATITVIDNNNVTRKYVTRTNGNFYTSDPIAFPALVIASSCPSAVRMTLASSTGDCNRGGCHVGGTNSQMHLP